MESGQKDTLKIISEKLNTTVLTRRISELYYSNPSSDMEPYKNYTIIEYIQLYKVNRMLELGVISEKEHDLLIEIFSIRKYLNNKLVSELIRESSSENIYIAEDKKYHSKNKTLLSNSIKTIDEILDKYHLYISPFKLERLIDYTIKGEVGNYQDIHHEEQLESVALLMRELKNK